MNLFDQGDVDHFVAVLRDAGLDGDRATVGRMAELLGNRLDGAVGLDEYGVWLDLELVGDGLVLRYVPPGSYVRGSPPEEADRFSDEGPKRPVTLTKGFWLGETPLTRREYQALHGASTEGLEHPQRPQAMVSWHQARATCERLSGRFRQLSFGLPTEAEWEYACRAGTTGRHWGESVGLTLADIAWMAGEPESRPDPAEVRLRPANPWGLTDMLGNVWEWCADHAPDRAEGRWRPLGGVDPALLEGRLRACRGGSHTSYRQLVRAAARVSRPPDRRDISYGFRVRARLAAETYG